MTNKTTESLHDQIMRLPCTPPKDANVNQSISYKSGHRDARHAAAELAAEHEAEQQQELTAIEAMARMLADGEWAEHVGQLGGPIAQRLETEITRMHNEQQAAQAAVPDELRAKAEKFVISRRKAAEFDRVAESELEDEDADEAQACAVQAFFHEEAAALVEQLLSAAPTPPAQQSQAAIDVLAERRRQIESEGWTPEHDDEHQDFQMSMAAACYAIGTPSVLGAAIWPWKISWWKPSPDARRNLVKAGALILAEIERLDRADKKELSNV